FGGQYGGVRRLLDVAQDGPHFAGGLFGLLGQVAHFVRDHRKTLALLARLGGFDGRIERQQVRLVRNVVDGGGDLADLLRLFGQRQDVLRDRLYLRTDVLHALDDGLDGLSAFLVDAQRRLPQLSHVAGFARRLLGAGPHLFDGRARLGDRGGLLVRARVVL